MHLERLRLFAELVNTGNFSRTADALNVSKAYLSKQIKALERDLSTQLIIRNTRSMRLTSAGEILFSQANKLTSFWQDSQNMLNASVDSLSGTVRFTAPTGLMEYVLLPVISEIRQRHPAINIVSETGNQTYNLVSEPYDFAVRITNTPPEDMVAVKLLSSDYTCVATPDFLARHGAPASPEQLTEFDCVTLSYWKSWPFRKGSQQIEVNLEGGLQFSDNALLKRATLASQGITRLARYMVEQELREGSLVELFSDYVPESRDIYLLYPQVIHRPERVKLIIDAIKQWGSKRDQRGAEPI